MLVASLFYKVQEDMINKMSLNKTMSLNQMCQKKKPGNTFLFLFYFLFLLLLAALFWHCNTLSIGPFVFTSALPGLKKLPRCAGL